ncbi:MAG TPA: flavin reductase [Alphaproteobacteria bacterium]|nr:flavin reductase [Alphaproteobacteria bacterium]HAJ45781.1 flavin reductase [Alphaproteobacteria bacterium]
MPTEMARKFRNALGCFTTGVCVAAARDAGGEAIGLTINSFASVSLEPPLILWSLDKGSDRMAVFEGASSFAVSVLGEADQALSQRLARKGEGLLEAGEWRAGPTGAPVLAQAIAHFDCDVFARYEGGDHVILLGHVRDFGLQEGDPPLIYFRGRYRELAPAKA